MHACDVLVMLGNRFPLQAVLPDRLPGRADRYPPRNLGRRCKIDLGLVGDVKLTIEALLAVVEEQDAAQASRRRHRALQEGARRAGLACQGHAGQQADPSAISGKDHQRPLHPTMPCSPPMSVRRRCGAAALSRHERPPPADRLVRARLDGERHARRRSERRPRSPAARVISLSGDGGFTMLMGDLITLTQMKLPVKVVRSSTTAWLGFVALEMKAAGFVRHQCRSGDNPDFAAMARAMGIFCEARRGSRRAFPGAMKEMLAHNGPALLDCRQPPQAGAVDAADHHARADQGLQPLGGCAP